MSMKLLVNTVISFISILVDIRGGVYNKKYKSEKILHYV